MNLRKWLSEDAKKNSPWIPDESEESFFLFIDHQSNEKAFDIAASQHHSSDNTDS